MSSPSGQASTSSTAVASENTPLLGKQPAAYDDGSSSDIRDAEGGEGAKGREVDVYVPGKSTFSQTVSTSHTVLRPT
jgi:hypothetical protein